jgi:hypothetical protein
VVVAISLPAATVQCGEDGEEVLLLGEIVGVREAAVSLPIYMFGVFARIDLYLIQ